MGLDIRAASHLRYVGPVPDEDEWQRLNDEAEAAGRCVSEQYFFLGPNDDGWDDRLGDMTPGLYECTPATEQHEFRAGTYSGYSDWREQLCRSALGVSPETVWENPEQFTGQPFVELIHFTDCDGRIGTAVAAKLATDFYAHTAGFAADVAGQEYTGYYLSTYRDFTTAFGLAGQGGALEFC
jgi:hypothetical protein